MQWREYEKRPFVHKQTARPHKAKPRPIRRLERTIKVSGEVAPEFLERMTLLGVRVKRVDG